MTTTWQISACFALALIACGVDRHGNHTAPDGVAGSESGRGGIAQGGSAGDAGGADNGGGKRVGGGASLLEAGAAGPLLTGGTQGSSGAAGRSEVFSRGAAGSAGVGGTSGSPGVGGAGGSADAGGGAGTGGNGSGGAGGTAGSGSETAGGLGGTAGIGGTGGNSGNSTCLEGFVGDRCDQCDIGHFGVSCQACSCVNGQCDDGIDGAGGCECAIGWTGPSCSQCDAGFWGLDCTLCQCDQGACDEGIDGTGACTCDAGWALPTCETCESDYYGPNCLACSCGGGTCGDGVDGDGACYDCPMGFVGEACDECQSNRYGADCDLCTCVHGSCNEGVSGNGSCECALGWDGPTCEVCASGFYGPQCTACPGTPTVGCPCTSGDTLACAGVAQKVQLQCPAGGGNWELGDFCENLQNCDSRDGSCAPIISECVGHSAGFTYCAAGGSPSDERRTCVTDLVAYSSTICGGICSQGICLAPMCGDAKLENAEECDDGGQVPADGCESDCRVSEVVQIALGSAHSCALFESGDVRCWGDNSYNQLGLGHADSVATSHPYQLPVLDLGGKARAISAGTQHSCAILTDNSIRCWGRNQYGQLGLGDQVDRLTQTPSNLGAISVGGLVEKISLGGAVSCALLQSGAVRCWGTNSSGRLGLGVTTPVSYTLTPAQYGPISLGAAATDIGFGTTFGCAILAGGTVRCWGYNSQGQLGRGHTNTIGDGETPDAPDSASASNGLVALAAGQTLASIRLGATHACITYASGDLQCWGQGAGGRLGRGSTSNIGDGESAAGLVELGAAASTVALGYDFTCAIAPSVGMKCWGQNGYGELGYGDLSTRGDSIASRPDALDAVAFGSRTPVRVFAGPSGQHVCVVLDNREVRCWGWNIEGQLGLGLVSTSPSYIGGDPSLVPALLASVAIFEAP